MRMPLRFGLWSVLIAAGACTSSSATQQDARPAIDARPAVDAPPPVDASVDGGPAGGKATEVDCISAATPAFVTAGSFAYNPMNTTVKRGDVVKFITPANADVASDVAGLVVPVSSVKCLTFNIAGLYSFHCTPTPFVGTVNVQ